MAYGPAEAIEAARRLAAPVFEVEASALRVDGVQAPSSITSGWSVLVGHTRKIPFELAGRGPGAVQAARIMEGFEPTEYVRHWVRLDVGNNLDRIEPYLPPE